MPKNDLSGQKFSHSLNDNSFEKEVSYVIETIRERVIAVYLSSISEWRTLDFRILNKFGVA